MHSASEIFQGDISKTCALGHQCTSLKSGTANTF